MAMNYAYKYAVLMDTTDGMCFQVIDTSDYILDPRYVPIEEYSNEYLMLYYYPIPESVTSFDDFQGKWYNDAAHTNEWLHE